MTLETLKERFHALGQRIERMEERVAHCRCPDAAQRREWHVELGRRIRTARRNLTLPGRYLEALGMWRSRLCRIERGQVELDVPEFRRLCQILGAIAIPELPRA